MAYEGVRNFLKREWFLSALVILYLALLLRDGSLLRRTPGLVDWGSLYLIGSLILVSRGLELSGIFTRLSCRLLSLSGGSERRLAFILLPTIAISSTVIMNDTAMLIFIPLILTLSRISGKDLSGLVILSSMAANVGSALTPIGNPQNVIIWNHYGIPFHSFVLRMLPFVFTWLLLLLLFAYFIFKGEIKQRELPPVSVHKSLLWASIILLAVDLILAQEGKALWTFPITLGVLLLIGRKVPLAVDWTLLLTFAFIFADFGEIALILSSSGVFFPHPGLGLFLTSAFLSQLVSNVPATVLLLGGSEWLPLAAGVNVGGTGLIIGSLANLIAVRIARVGIKEFHRYSVPYFLLVTLLSLLILWL
ncbi:carboxylate transporter [Thermococcus celericrescens]|uniref:Carboxylate transporter n=1 Tax=Thermococcus celericrescens TaxID=227598 RepID=A0A117ITS9_9EURY|nr:SLC13 family permease [Thermococcus celericrescens]KUH34523.1 carboxylate transporter [Thermococcus celericrescens]